jgi:hypothetical protein
MDKCNLLVINLFIMSASFGWRWTDMIEGESWNGGTGAQTAIKLAKQKLWMEGGGEEEEEEEL